MYSPQSIEPVTSSKSIGSLPRSPASVTPIHQTSGEGKNHATSPLNPANQQPNRTISIIVVVVVAVMAAHD